MFIFWVSVWSLYIIPRFSNYVIVVIVQVMPLVRGAKKMEVAQSIGAQLKQ